MTITYSHDDPVSARWSGVDGGRPITAYEGDFNFYQHETRIATLEVNYTLTTSIATITQPTSSTMRVTLTDATYSDITMPIAGFRSRGDWAVDTPYLFNDTFNAPDGGLYQVLFDHTSDATSFDPNDNDGAGHDYYASMIPPRGNTIPAGGAVGMYFRKNSALDYVANWSYIQASEVVYSASTGSLLVSTTVSAALEELEALIASSIGDIVVAAVDVTFTAPTGSALVSINVSDALVELEGLIAAGPDLSAYAPLASPALTGNPTAPTPSPGDNDTSIATTGFVKAAIDVVLGGVSASFDTLSEIASALATKLALADVVGKQTIWVPAAAMVARTTNGPASGTAEMSSNKNMVKTLDFDATTQEFAQFDVAMPKSWNNGTVTFQPVWSHAATVTNFGVVFGVDAVAISDDDTLDVAFGTAQTSTDTGGTTNDLYVGAESSAITIAGTPATGDVVQFRVHRDPANGSDTMAVDARLHGVKVFYTTNAATDA